MLTNNAHRLIYSSICSAIDNSTTLLMFEPSFIYLCHDVLYNRLAMCVHQLCNGSTYIFLFLFFIGRGAYKIDSMSTIPYFVGICNK